MGLGRWMGVATIATLTGAHCRDDMSSNGFMRETPSFGMYLLENHRGPPDALPQFGNQLRYAVDGSDLEEGFDRVRVQEAILDLLSAQATYDQGQPMHCGVASTRSAETQTLSCQGATEVSVLAPPPAPVTDGSGIPLMLDPSCGMLRDRIFEGNNDVYVDAPPSEVLAGDSLAYFQLRFNRGARVLLEFCQPGFSSWDR